MAVKPLDERQLFRMKRENLEKRINLYYLETHDTDTVLEYSLAVLVFNGITIDDYSFVCKDLIKEIFLTNEPSDKLRDYCLYFYDFFEYEEWERVRDRLFKNRAAFSEHTRAIRPETKYVRAESAPTAETLESSEDYFETVFKDELGKKHKQRFRNVDVDMPNKKLFTLLKILTKLTIFEKDGVRRFTQVVPADCKTIIADTF